MPRAIFRYTFPRNYKDKRLLIYGDFNTLRDGSLENTVMECFWETHGYELGKGDQEGWIAVATEGIWCTAAKGWIEIKKR